MRAYLLPSWNAITSPALLDVNFETWSPGFYDASAFLAQTFIAPVKSKLKLERDYGSFSNTANAGQGETVQTSASTLLRSASAIQTDIARIGRRISGGPAGLVIEPCMQNKAPDSINTAAANATRDIDAATGWNAGNGCTITRGYGDSPDQSVTGCTRIVTIDPGGSGSTGFGPYGDQGAITTRCNYSIWQKSTGGGGGSAMFIDWTNGNPWAGAQRGASASWGRLEFAKGATALRFTPSSDSRNWLGAPNVPSTGGPSNQARDILADYAQITIGDYPLEVIPTAGGRRAGDKFSYSTLSELLAVNGQIKFRAKFSPKHASTEQVYLRRLRRARPA